MIEQQYARIRNQRRGQCWICFLSKFALEWPR